MENEVVKRLMWSGLLASVGAVTAIVSRKIAEVLWIRLFDEEPPVD